MLFLFELIALFACKVLSTVLLIASSYSYSLPWFATVVWQFVLRNKYTCSRPPLLSTARQTENYIKLAYRLTIVVFHPNEF